MESILNRVKDLKSSNRALVVGIDGLSGSGKTTLSRGLKAEIENIGYDAVVFHIDDFINDRSIRYDDSKEEWYCFYYIQWRYNYLVNEVLKHVHNGEEVHKDIELYNKEKDSYDVVKLDITKNTVVILEGVFLQRTEIRKYLDLVVYLDVPREVRLERVILRDTYIGGKEEVLNKYERRYLPGEEKYIKEHEPAKNADIVI